MHFTTFVISFFRVRYHAARGLIYLGCLDVGGVYLFKRVPGEDLMFCFHLTSSFQDFFLSKNPNNCEGNA